MDVSRAGAAINGQRNGQSIKRGAWKRITANKYLLVMLLPVLLYFLIFSYVPMYGVVIAFQDYLLGKGMLESPWVGLKHFRDFFKSIFFARTFMNTILLSVYSLVWGFWIPLVFALFLNELKGRAVKRFIQTVSYLPHFISLVVVVGMMKMFLDPMSGVINGMIAALGFDKIDFFGSSEWFRTLYVSSGIWQSFGWSSIIYLAALAGVDPTLYESADIDGASRLQKMFYITLPSLYPVTFLLLILSLGNMMSVGFEKVILMYSPATYDVSDIISTYTYRKGILEKNYSFGTAIGLFNSVINMTLLIVCNWLSRKATKHSIW
ncbi:ABC transporter permease [Paenibacillus contaminans]|uniref:Sugar ABC transporter permease n=1 Tax=Paenibacillus contaminans TaxID=450362 RepID=A0A329MDB5_9BACL|nr:ABC transporter permease subunit [Paenibacillus contaminans]RAV17830.1 sugar ABC transporter permease [Paenibacillus contaminans]